MVNPVRISVSTLILIVFLFSNSAQAQHKKSNWLQDKKEHTGRWRVGFGADIAEPTGIDIQFYRLSRICTGDFSITKKIAIGTWAGKEGLFFGNITKRSNSVEWETSGLRYGIDLKLYLPVFFNPYIGVGIEGGTRTLNGVNDFYPDVIARIGIEQKVLGLKLSTKSSLNITIFVDGKFNKCLNSDFYYILPSGGVRFHLL